MKEKLLFRRQFIIGKNLENKLEWDKENLVDGLTLYNHADLQKESVSLGNKKLILLGYIINPNNYKEDNRTIIEKLFENSNNFDNIKKQTISLGGRWLLLYINNDEFKILTDPSSLRRIFYTKKDELLIGSDTSIINYFKKQELSNDPKLLEYLNSKYCELSEFEFYNDNTIYKNIYKVLPNRYLDVKTRSVHKFWVDVEKKSYDENLEIISNILVNEIKALYNRSNNIICSISAGIDSRIMYAASKKAEVPIKYFVSTMNTLNEKDADIYIPKKITKDNNDDFIILDNLESFRDDFLEIYEMNIENARKLPKNLTIQAILDKFDNPYVITGNNAEVIVHYYDKDDVKYGKEISKLLGIPDDITYFNESFQAWLDEARPFLDKHKDIVPMKLFHWEQDTGNWGTLYQAESDIASEEFPPFNNREIFLRFWQCSKEKNYGKEEVYRDLLAKLDKSLLEYPINPLNFKEKIREFIRNNLSHTNYIKLKLFLKR